MTISLDDLQKAVEQAEKIGSSSSGGFKTITKVNLAFGYCVFDSPPKMFPHKLQDEADRERAKVEAEAHHKALGKTGKPAYGIITTMWGDDRPQHPDGKLDFNPQEFVPTWQSDKHIERFTEEELGLKGNAPMPFTAVLDGVTNNGATEVFGSDPVWVLMGQVVDGYKAAKGSRQDDKNGKVDDEGNTVTYPWRVHVIEKLYASEAEAKAEAAELSSGGSTSDGGNLSDKATKDGGWTWATWIDQAESVQGVVNNAIKGIDAEGKEMKALTPKKAKEYAAQQYDVEVADVELLDEPAF